ncbi:MAG: MmcQ/YjbR family DNA-binding protein [Bacteroidetes bacterium]|nr:MmcQ/YjbR family DNA-binding protein [Bacteroidota bacterium]
MDIESLRTFCLSLPHAEEDLKWGNDLCFTIVKKIFCSTGLEGEFGVSLKVRDEEFEELSETDGIIPAPYAARNKWILVRDPNRWNQKEWEHYITQSYEMIKSKLPKRVLNELDKQPN